ncbi:ABC transporter ATP-binding protein [Desulfitobacterium sp.]|uniref:ABC transporter ATP-binding protein n=1 Tax=Desulfitobacterium sp. TaxID=49981 RepID=UPI002B1E9ACB|nr:ATP-binding cassette domain-containing protein [Desulfitobacterium sp.]MEA4900014.1 ATP-binding cassette domain-containing protein [Desulfitobacterium sp.]
MLEIEDVSFQVESDEKNTEILKGINLKLESKKIYVITGPNGGGKSSLAKILMGIYSPTSGKILLDGEDITYKDISERARLGVGYAFQNPPRFKGLTVRELLELSTASNPEKVNISDLLVSVGLCAQDYLDRDADASLSGGEMKRIEIASVLARNLKVAVFDEPEAGIDLWSFQKLAESFRHIHEQYNTTIVIISHQERIFELADEIILLKNGTISQQAEKDRLLSVIFKNEDCLCTNPCEKGMANDAQFAR